MMQSHLLLFIVVTVIVHSIAPAAPFVSVYNAYGNELEIANTIHNHLSNISSFNVSEYIYEVDQCRSSSKMFQCTKWVNNWHRQRSRLWMANDRNLATDCAYTIDRFYAYKLINIEANNVNMFEFIVSESMCSTNISIYGGSTFVAFAHNNHSTVSCTTMDYMNQTYSIQCLMDILSSLVPQCVYLTLILSHEHFDDFSLALHDWTDKFPPRQIFLANDKQYCVESYSQGTSPSNDGLVVSSRINWYTGRWTSTAQNISRTYLWNESYSVIFNNTEDTEYMLATYETNDKPFLNENPVLFQRSKSIETSYVLKKIFLRSIDKHRIRDMPMKYHFIGSSHMRHWFDGFIAKTLGNDFNNLNLSAKHHGHAINNIQYYGALLALDVSNRIRDICNATYQSLSDYPNHTLFIQTGSWDLGLGALIKLLRDRNAAMSLLSTLEGILRGDILCKGLKHIVWMTMVPYPLCDRRYGNKCDENRSFRSNPAIAAWNVFFINELSQIMNNIFIQAFNGTLPEIKVSVIDVYTIVKPRMVFDPAFEVVCTNHFLCRRDRTDLFLTPGGIAVLEAMFAVIED